MTQAQSQQVSEVRQVSEGLPEKWVRSLEFFCNTLRLTTEATYSRDSEGKAYRMRIKISDNESLKFDWDFQTNILDGKKIPIRRSKSIERTVKTLARILDMVTHEAWVQYRDGSILARKRFNEIPVEIFIPLPPE